MQLPEAGILQLQDAESGKDVWVDSNNATVRYNYQQHFFKQTEDTKVYFNAYFEIDFFDGAIKNQEPDKCSELIFLSLDELKDQKVVPYVHHALDCIRDGKIFSEIRWNIGHDS